MYDFEIKRSFWTEEEAREFLKEYPEGNMLELARKYGRSVGALRTYALNHGVYRSKGKKWYRGEASKGEASKPEPKASKPKSKPK